MTNQQTQQLPSPGFNISNILKTAWSNISGSKLAIWLGALAMIILAALVNFIVLKISGTNIKNPSYILNNIVMPIVLNAIVAPFYAGIFMVAIKRARGESVKASASFQYFNKSVPLAITMVIVGFIAAIAMMIFNLPVIVEGIGRANLAWLDVLGGLFSALIYSFLLIAVPLVADKDKSPTEAIRTSFQWLKPIWYKVFVLLIISYFCGIITIIPVLIAAVTGNEAMLIFGAIWFVATIIWILPFIFQINGSIYHTVVDKKQNI